MRYSLNKNLPNKISVVIPTLAGELLIKTVESVFLSKLDGMLLEVIIVAPVDKVDNLKSNLKNYNVTIIGVEKLGQVFQRSIGFKAALGDVVVQLDDDMLFEKNLLLNLTKNLILLGNGNLVAPLIKDELTGIIGQKTHPRTIKGFLKNLEDFLIFGLPFDRNIQGVFSVYSRARGIDPSLYADDRIEVGWLPGGFVMGYKSELIFDDFYQIKGKAFAEDLIHSQIRTSHGLKHWLLKNLVTVHLSPLHQDCRTIKQDLILFISEVKKYIWVSNRLGGYKPRIYFAVIIQSVSQVIKLLKNINLN
jgi:glycosyltransferase involved in cell wall biosynthesis